MPPQRKTAAILFPGSVLYVGLAVLWFHLPSECPLIALLFFMFVLATHVMISHEAATVFAGVTTLIELAGLAIVDNDNKIWLVGHIFWMWAGLGLLRRFNSRDRQHQDTCAAVLKERQVALQQFQKEKESLEKRVVELDEQVALRQHLFNSVHQLASLLDPVIVRQRLMEFVRSTIPRGTIHYFAGNVPRDPMDRWVMERKLSLLVTDVSADSRFKAVRAGNEVRSVLAAPMVVERQLVGILRLNGFDPGLYSIGDLRILEALVLMASLALENLQLLARLREGAVRDNLTALYTHRFFEERLAEEILRAGRYHTEFCLLLMDIDHFKRYNDTYGHAAGDQVLVRFSQLLQRLARPVDLVSRYGGEEFVVLLPQTTMTEARGIAEQIRGAIEAEEFNFGQDAAAQERVTVSIGVSGFPTEATIASQLVRVADSRLYEAKKSGRNRVIG